MSRTVYHGATTIVRQPLANVGRKKLDFGQGFYVTDIEKQVTEWATRAVNTEMAQFLNIYQLDDLNEYRGLVFKEYDQHWFKFIVASRKGEMPWKNYEYIEGGIADDRVINTIEDYLNGDIPFDYALKRLAEHKPNNQLCLISQTLIDQCLHFVEAKPLNPLAKQQLC